MIYGTSEFNENLLKMITDKKHRHETYEESVNHAKEVGVHLYGDSPKDILERVRPREDPEVKKYRLDSWEPFTKSTADKALTIVAKMSNPTLYSIRWEEESEASKELKKWALQEYPFSNSIVNFFFEVLLRRMIADPNAIIAIRQLKAPETELERVKPIIFCYGSKAIWWKDYDHYLVNTGVEKVKGVDVYRFSYFDKDMNVMFKAWSINAKDLMIQEDQRYEYNFGDKGIPVWELKGNQEVKDEGAFIYKSFFEPAIPFWNKAINHESDLEGAYIQHIHPLRVEASIECDYILDGQRCRNGYITNPDNGTRSACPSCGGSGVRGMLNSPHGLIRVNVDQFKNESGTGAGIAPVSFVAVPTEPTAMLEQRVDKLLERGLYALNMDIVNRIGENQSGRAKVIDRGELYDFLFKISSLIFDTHLPNIFYYFNLFMFGVEKSEEELEKILPEIAKPTQFDISTAQELLQEYDIAKKAGSQDDYLKNKQKQINAKEFANDPDLKKRMDLIVDHDPLPGLDVDDLIAQSQKGWITQMDLVIHCNIGHFIKRAFIEDPKFDEKRPEEQRIVLEQYAQEVIDANRETLEEVTSPEADDTDDAG